MKNLDLLPLSPEVKKRLDEFARQYARMAHIVIEIVSFSESRLIVRAEQKDLVNGQFLSKKELHERASGARQPIGHAERSRSTGRIV